MSFHDELAQGDLLSVGGAAIEDTPNLSMQQYPIASFNPVNHYPAPLQFVSPHQTLHTDVDKFNETLDESPENTSLEKHQTRGRKAGSPPSKYGRSYSLGAVWQYIDEEDLEFQTQNPPKRRKSSPVKHKPTKPSPLRMQILQPDGADGLPPLSHESGQELQSPQLTTPSDSSKWTKGRARSKISKGRKAKLGFKNLTVTKHVQVSEKERHNDPIPVDSPSQHLINYQGWTSTQDTLKLHDNVIATTTLDKLAKFRYNQSPQSVSRELTTRQSAHSIIEPTDDLESPNTEPAAVYFSSDYGTFLSSDNNFREAIWSAERSTSFTSDSLVAEHLYTNYRVDEERGSTAHSFLRFENQYELKLRPIPAESLPGSLPRGIACTEDTLPEEIVHFSSSQQTFHYESTSSEAQALSYLSEKIDTREADQVPFDWRSRYTPIAADVSGAELFPDGGGQFRDGVSEVVSANSFPVEAEQIYGGPEMLPSKIESVHSSSQPAVDIQIEKSEINGLDSSCNVVSDEFSNDEFDEGLDDVDLLAMALDIVPDTQPGHLSARIIQDQPTDSRPLYLPAELEPGSHLIAEIVPENQLSLNPPGLDTSIPSSDLDDEYPIDVEDEEEMLKLADIPAGINEGFGAPASVQLPFEEAFESEEVYDRSLQFSSPTSKKEAASPRKGVNGFNANHHRNLQPPSPISGTEPNPLGEEDWTFMGSHNQNKVSVEASAGAVAEDPKLSKLYLTPRDKTYGHFAPEITRLSSDSISAILDDSCEFEALPPFVRSNFPNFIRDRSPVVGFSAQKFLRVCFRIGEMFKQAVRCNATKDDAVIELYARVTFSSRESGTTKQYFQFADLWSDRPPFPNGILMNYKSTDLGESESKVFIGRKGKMARCLGRLKRAKREKPADPLRWLFHIITIRGTDWEEIRWTKRIVDAHLLTSDEAGFLKS